MAVLKSNRGLSEMEFVHTARELQRYTIQKCVGFPKDADHQTVARLYMVEGQILPTADRQSIAAIYDELFVLPILNRA